MNTTTNTFSIYEGSQLFYSVETDLNISEDFVEMQLAKSYEYRKSDKYWAAVKQGGFETRYKLEYGVGIKETLKFAK